VLYYQIKGAVSVPHDMLHQTAGWLQMKYLKRCGRKQQGQL